MDKKKTNKLPDSRNSEAGDITLSIECQKDHVMELCKRLNKKPWEVHFVTFSGAICFI